MGDRTAFELIKTFFCWGTIIAYKYPCSSWHYTHTHMYIQRVMGRCNRSLLPVMRPLPKGISVVGDMQLCNKDFDTRWATKPLKKHNNNKKKILEFRWYLSELNLNLKKERHPVDLRIIPLNLFPKSLFAANNGQKEKMAVTSNTFNVHEYCFMMLTNGLEYS